LKITSFSIKGFGIFTNSKVDETGNGICLFTGQNESGKSTLMRFIRSCLFGMKGQRGSIDEPLNGGSHGGTMDIVLEDGSTQRMILDGRKLFFEDSGPGNIQLEDGPPWISVSRELFDRVFCLGLEDLSKEGSRLLDDRSVRNRLFSASAGLGDISLTEVFSSLSDEMASIIKTRGRSSGTVGDLKHKISEVDSKMLELGDAGKRYSDLQDKKITLEGRIAEISGEIERTRRELNQSKRLENLLGPWNELKGIEESLKFLMAAENFPPSGEQRFLEIKKQKDAFLKEITGKEKFLEKKRIELDSLEINWEVLKMEGEIEKLRDERSAISGLPEENAVLGQKLEGIKKELNGLLEQIANSWETGDLESADLSFNARQEAAKMINDISDIRRERSTCNEMLSKLQREQERSHGIYQDIKNDLLDYGERIPEKKELERDFASIDQLRDVLEESSRTSEKTDHLKQSVSENRKRVEDLISKRGSSKMFIPYPWIAGMVILLCGSIILSFFMPDPLPALLAAGISGFVTAGSFLLNSVQSRNNRKIESELEKEITRLDQRYEELVPELDEYQVRMKKQELQIRDLAGGLGIDSSMLKDEAHLFRLSLKNRFNRLKTISKMVDDLERAHLDLEEKVRFLEEKEQYSQVLEEKMEGMLKCWREWLQAHFLPVDTRPSDLAGMVQNILSAKRVLSSLKDVTAEYERTAMRLHEKNDLLDRLVSRGGLRCGVDDPAVKIDILVSALGVQKDRLRKRDHLQDNIEQLLLDIDAQKENFSRYQKELDELLKTAGCEKEEDFFRLSRDSRDLEELRKNSRHIKSRITGIAGSEEELQKLQEELEDSDPIEIKADIDTCRQKLERLEKIYDEAQKELGATESLIRELSVDKRQSQLIQEREFLLTEASRASRRWMKLALCRSLIEQAMEKYEKERQPEVVELAGRYMRTITGGRYGLLSSFDDHRIVLTDLVHDQKKEEPAWSSGLADQAYICLRLSLAVVLGRMSEPLPIVLDDIHLRFDHERQKGLARVLLEVSRVHQVFFFSCSPAFRQILSGVTPARHSKPPRYFSLTSGKVAEDEVKQNL